MKQLFRFTVVLAAILVTVFNSAIIAQEKPIQLSLFTPVQIVPEDQSAKGFRFNLIYGKNAAMTGLDIGLVNMSTSLQKGVQWGGGKTLMPGMIDSHVHFNMMVPVSGPSEPEGRTWERR